MARGEPLTDEERFGWPLHEAMHERMDAGDARDRMFGAQAVV